MKMMPPVRLRGTIRGSTDATAHLAEGVEGDEPPLEEEGARDSHRHKTAAGLYAVYETGHFGFKEMGV